MNIRLASPLQSDSIVDGEGIRTVIWTQGCSHNCEGCHNPETHSFTDGTLVDVDEIKKQIDELEYQDGITLSGGDPFFQPKECEQIALYAKSKNLNVWAYTGFTFEDLLKTNNSDIYNLLKSIDILIDGKFELENRSMNCVFRGSTNQRIIDVKESLLQKKAVLATKYINK